MFTHLAEEEEEDCRANFRFMWPCIIKVGEERTNGWHK